MEKSCPKPARREAALSGFFPFSPQPVSALLDFIP